MNDDNINDEAIGHGHSMTAFTKEKDDSLSERGTVSSPLILVRSLVRTYEQPSGEVRALDGVDLEVSRGEFTALMGPSGSGKTTLLNCLGALDVPSEGEIYLNGQLLSDMKRRERAELRRDGIGFMQECG